MAKACIKRLHALEDDSLVSAIASQPTDVAKQICLYALMKQSRLVWEFMVTVIGGKYRLRDRSFGKIDLNTFFMRLHIDRAYIDYAKFEEMTQRGVICLPRL